MKNLRGHFWSMTKVALRFGCAKQSKNLKRYLLCTSSFIFTLEKWKKYHNKRFCSNYEQPINKNQVWIKWTNYFYKSDKPTDSDCEQIHTITTLFSLKMALSEKVKTFSEFVFSESGHFAERTRMTVIFFVLNWSLRHLSIT